MEVRVNTLHICQRDSLSEDHLVECADEESIKEASMENRKTYYAANELEVVEMLRINARVWVDL